MELYKDLPDNAYLKIYVEGVLTNADGDVSAELFDIDGSSLDDDLTVTHVSTGIYKVTVPASATAEEGNITIEWSYDSVVKIDIYSIITPYIEISDLLEIVPEGTSWKDAKYAEAYARNKIDAMTGQSFGNQYKQMAVKGKGTDILIMPQRIISFNELVENNELVVDDTTNTFNHNIEVSKSNFAIMVSTTEDVIEYRQTGIRSRGGAFKEAWDYKVTGRFGWENVPEDIRSCSKELIKNYFCSDNTYREGYVLNVKSNTWQIEFDTGVFSGTGNFYVDSILSDYVWIQMVVI